MQIISLKYREKVVPINLENEGFDSRFFVHLIFAEPLVLCARKEFPTPWPTQRVHSLLLSTQSHPAAPLFTDIASGKVLDCSLLVRRCVVLNCRA